MSELILKFLCSVAMLALLLPFIVVGVLFVAAHRGFLAGRRHANEFVEWL